MPRRGNVAKREVLADPIYNSKVVTRLVNYIMLDGKKGVAQEIVYDAFDIVKEKTGNDPLEMFEKAMENIMPNLECKTRVSAALTIRFLWKLALPARDPRPALADRLQPRPWREDHVCSSGC